MSIKILIAIALPVSLFGQAYTYGDLGSPQSKIIGTTAVLAWRPVSFDIAGTDPSRIVMSSGTGAILGCAQASGGNPGGTILISVYGTAVCQFSTVPTPGNVATVAGGLLVDSGSGAGSNVAISLGQPGRIGKLRADACTTCAEINLKAPASLGTMIPASYLTNDLHWGPNLTALANIGGVPTATLADGTTVAMTGSTIPAAQIQTDWTAVSGLGVMLHKPILAAVATSGLYADLTSKPTIPAAQVNSDWTASSGLTQILNKPTLATVATTGAYNDLTGKPTLPSTFPQCFNTSGAISNCKIWVGSATTNSSGVATFNLTAAGFSAAPTMCSFMATATASAANSLNVTGVTGYTATQAQAFVTQPISLLGLGLLPVALVNGATVQAACTGT